MRSMQSLSSRAHIVWWAESWLPQDMKRRNQWGHIINISSMASHRVPSGAGGGSAFYAATKHAVKALTEGLRQEV